MNIDLSKWRPLEKGEVMRSGDAFKSGVEMKKLDASHMGFGHKYDPSTWVKMYRPIVTTKATDTQVDGDHYSKLAIQPITYTLANKLGFCEGNIVKYITRHKDKHGEKDIRKIMHYCEFILEDQYKATKPTE